MDPTSQSWLLHCRKEDCDKTFRAPSLLQKHLEEQHEHIPDDAKALAERERQRISKQKSRSGPPKKRDNVTDKHQKETIVRLEAKMRELEQELAQVTARNSDLQTQNRQLHNEIQNLKGNIRVICRVRPLLDDEKGKNVPIATFTCSERRIVVSEFLTSAMGSALTKDHTFEFNKVFQSLSTQEDVFGEISQLVQSAINGFNVCIFAYGQTGSGKTYTMQGGSDDHDRGMIPRALQMIYNAIESLKSEGWEYTVEGQFMEIYNDTIFDLLQDRKRAEAAKIVHSQDGDITVSNVTTVVFDSAENALHQFRKAMCKRAVASTQHNAASSRSHSIFTLRLSGTNMKGGESWKSALNLIDLAGSERLPPSGTIGPKKKETEAINSSLSCLGNVINAIKNKQLHVPYRESKLTYMLQGFLSGNSKVLMFVNVSPLNEDLQETVCSLRFAQRANSCHIGNAASPQSRKTPGKTRQDIGTPLRSMSSRRPTPSSQGIGGQGETPVNGRLRRGMVAPSPSIQIETPYTRRNRSPSVPSDPFLF